MRWLGWAVGLAMLAAAGGGGCGSGGGEGNNDQGISFRAVGFFQGTDPRLKSRSLTQPLP